MAKLSKRMSALKKSINQDRKYNIIDGLELLKKFTSTRFVENVDVAINLGIDARKSNQNIRGYVLMPHGIGRNIYVAVFAQAESAKLAKDSGADLVGLHDLADQIKKKVSNKLDVVVAMPDTMNIVSRLGSILGPRGLMPNPKVGTVSDNISETVKNIKKGQIRYRNDKNGIIHAGFGKINFSSVNLKENLEALILSLKQMKPKNYKGEYIKKITISTTMGVSVLINENSLFVSV